MIQIIDCRNICEYSEKDITEEMAGRKAMGLLQVPLAWRLPFFVVHQNVAADYIERTLQERKELLSAISERIRICLRKWEFEEEAHIIIRSSGKEEGISERGKCDSENCTVSALRETVEKLFDLSIRESYGPIAYIVQPFIDRKRYGHLSNERRVSQHARDWKYEFEGSNGEDEIYPFGVRSWRTTYDIEAISMEPLDCFHEKKIESVLRRAAYFYTKQMKQRRVHLEFVWNGSRIFIVQNDIEQHSDTEVNPKSLVKISDMDKLDHLKVFCEVDKSRESEFYKIENVRKYADLGLPTAPFYMIRDREIIASLAQGCVSEELKEDIMLLVSHSVVVRTDVSKYETADRQLLPRSNELRCFDDFIEWAGKGLPELLKYQNIILLVHVFIPAVAAAFAYAAPDNRIVTIQSLWGLPEGLYYNTHDTTQVDTGTKYMSHVDGDKIAEIRMCRAYKGYFYAPDDAGVWREMTPAPPYDWQMSVTERQATYIAWASRRIAQKESRPLSIMWFVGVDEKYYKTNCLPWYHEEILESTFTHNVYQKKYYTQRVEKISSGDDLLRIKEIAEVGAITIHPQNDGVLRNKGFLKAVGEFAKEHNIAIFLDGTVLAHPVYRLMSQGVKVVLTNSEKILFGWEQFNKLVRDKIPDKIQSNMEGVRCYVAKEGLLLRYLKEKLVEEAYEVIDAEWAEDIMEELADAREVTAAIRQTVQESEYFRVNRTGKPLIVKAADWAKEIRLNSLAEKVEKTEYTGGYFMEFSLERSHQELELELRFSEEEQRDNPCDEDAKTVQELLCLAYQLLDTYESDKICQMCSRIEEQIAFEAEKLGRTCDEVAEIGERKRNKNGGFQKGYILKETSKNAGKKKGEPEDNIWGENETEAPYAEIKELLFRPVTYVDYRETAQPELIIRIRYPVCFENWSNKFAGKSINQMFGEDSRLYVAAERVCEKYRFCVMLEKKKYQQLRLEFPRKAR